MMFEIKSEVKETDCTCDPPCGYIHRRIVGHTYVIDGLEVDKETYALAVNRVLTGQEA